VIIEVRGTPAPQGSKRHVGGGRMIEVSRAVGPWREAVRAETQRAMISPGASGWIAEFDGPVEVIIDFWLNRPKSTPRKVVFPVKRPDLDKLARAVLDGLTAGGAWKDDSQVIRLGVAKYYSCEGTPPPGCKIDIREIAP
jgi:crossover junction endodeoxyribonuclease RusA